MRDISFILREIINVCNLLITQTGMVFFDSERRVIDKNVATVQSQIHGGNVQLRE